MEGSTMYVLSKFSGRRSKYSSSSLRTMSITPSWCDVVVFMNVAYVCVAGGVSEHGKGPDGSTRGVAAGTAAAGAAVGPGDGSAGGVAPSVGAGAGVAGGS